MARKRAPYAKRSLLYVVIGLAAIVVIGFAALGYEVNHLRTEVNGLQSQLHALSSGVAELYAQVLKLLERTP
jgi:hypothetical protein